MCSSESASCLCFAPEEGFDPGWDGAIPLRPRPGLPNGGSTPIRFLTVGEVVYFGHPYDEHTEWEILARENGRLRYTERYILPAGNYSEELGMGEIEITDAPVATLGAPGEVHLSMCSHPSCFA